MFSFLLLHAAIIAGRHCVVGDGEGVKKREGRSCLEESEEEEEVQQDAASRLIHMRFCGRVYMCLYVV